ncbi:MAG TPA: carbohydrate ABC transporter permease [Capsulimonadaceae bacterium]|nr:carbohydrate ABC transporter permease [Capsulimonadaceae bacterium]
MNAVLWLIVVVFGYAVLGLWLAQAIRAFHVHRHGLGWALLALPVLLCLALGALPHIVSQRFSVREALFLLEALYGLATVVLYRAFTAGEKEPIVPLKERKPAFLHLALVTGSAIFLVPFAWLLISSVKSDDQMASYPPEIVPRQQVMVTVNGAPHGLVRLTYKGRRVLGVDLQDNPNGTLVVKVLGTSDPNAVVTAEVGDTVKVRHFSPRWLNYSEALHFLPPEAHYGLVFLANTLIIAILSVLGTVLSSSLVAYSFARLNWPGRDIVFGLVLATMMIPSAVTMMPNFLIFRALHWVDTLLPLWVPSFFGAAFNVFLLRQFFMGIPKELEDAAKIDGCSYFTTYWRIMMPQVRPALAAVAITTFLAAWNNYQGPLIYISSPSKMPLSYALQLFQSQNSGEPGMLMAATTLVVLPVIALFFFTQRYFIQGLSLTGLGGR